MMRGCGGQVQMAPTFSFCVNQTGGPFADGFSFSGCGGRGGITGILAAFVPGDGKGPPAERAWGVHLQGVLQAPLWGCSPCCLFPPPPLTVFELSFHQERGILL